MDANPWENAAKRDRADHLLSISTISCFPTFTSAFPLNRTTRTRAPNLGGCIRIDSYHPTGMLALRRQYMEVATAWQPPFTENRPSCKTRSRSPRNRQQSKNCSLCWFGSRFGDICCRDPATIPSIPGIQNHHRIAHRYPSN